MRLKVSLYKWNNIIISELANLVKTITGFSHHFGDCVIHGIATTHSANLEAGEGKTWQFFLVFSASEKNKGPQIKKKCLMIFFSDKTM